MNRLTIDFEVKPCGWIQCKAALIVKSWNAKFSELVHWLDKVGSRMLSNASNSQATVDE